MHVLALDTTTADGSAALVVDDRVIEERRGDLSRTHAERLPGEITTLAAAHGVALADVDLFAVASGPGSFTGLRIGIATIQGLAFVGGRKVAALSALDALAHIAGLDAPGGTIVGAWIDAHRREVFSALYRVHAGAPFALDRLEEIDAPAVGDPAATLARWAAVVDRRGAIFVGDGAARYADLITSSHGGAIVPTPLLAGAIGRLATARAQRGEAVEPAAIHPLYVRRPDAEVHRDMANGKWQRANGRGQRAEDKSRP